MKSSRSYFKEKKGSKGELSLLSLKILIFALSLNFNSKMGADCHGVILYFHDSAMFDEGQIVSQLGHTLDNVICEFII